MQPKQPKTISIQKSGLFFIVQVSHLISNPTEHPFQTLNKKTECAETHKQAGTESVCSKVLSEHIKRGNTASDDVSGNNFS